MLSPSPCKTIMRQGELFICAGIRSVTSMAALKGECRKRESTQKGATAKKMKCALAPVLRLPTRPAPTPLDTERRSRNRIVLVFVLVLVIEPRHPIRGRRRERRGKIA